MGRLNSTRPLGSSLLSELIGNAREAVPKAFVRRFPVIPWVNESRVGVVPLGEDRGRRGFPRLFLNPEKELPAMDGHLKAEIRRSGIEALAWYAPFHHDDSWGIYLRARGILYLTSYFRSGHTSADVNEDVGNATEVLLYHEFFHFLTEITATHMELSYLRPLFEPYLLHVESLRDETANIEESLANAYVLTRLSRWHHGIIKSFFSSQPGSYCLFDAFASDEDFLMGKLELGSMIHSGGLQGQHSLGYQEPLWEFLFNVTPERLFVRDIPVYLVFEPSQADDRMRFITPIVHGARVAAYPSDHLPHHLHIWIPADAGRLKGKYLYPSLEPYGHYPPLSNAERKKVDRLIEENRTKIEESIRRQQ